MVGARPSWCFRIAAIAFGSASTSILSLEIITATAFPWLVIVTG
ncbi:MAG: hypothetical protein ACOYMT_04600 [Chthoniobacterales bacterium]